MSHEISFRMSSHDFLYQIRFHSSGSNARDNFPFQTTTMEYLPGSYESKLNSLFKPSNVNVNKSLISSKEGIISYPIFIPGAINDTSTIYDDILTSTISPLISTIIPILSGIEPQLSTPTPTPQQQETHSDEFKNISVTLSYSTTTVATEIGLIEETESIEIENVSSTWSSTSFDNDPTTWIPMTETSPTFTTTILSFDNETSSPYPIVIPEDNGHPLVIASITSPELLITYGFFVIFLSIMGIISNSATIHVLFHDSINLDIRKHYTNMTILSLASVNLCASIFVGFGGGINILCSAFGGNEYKRQVMKPHGGVPNDLQSLSESSSGAFLNKSITLEMFANIDKNISDEDRNEENIGFSKWTRGQGFHDHRHQHHEPLWICQLQCFFTNLGSFVSIWTLALITVDRFFAHNWPLKYNQFVNRTHFTILMTYIWLQGVLFSILSLHLWNDDHKMLQQGKYSGLCHCLINWLIIPGYLSIGVTLIKVFSFIWMQLIPYSAIFSLNTILVHKSLDQRTKVTTVMTVNVNEPESTETNSDSPAANSINRFFSSNPHHDQSLWRVMPPPPRPLHQQYFGVHQQPPIERIFRPTLVRQSRVIGGQGSNLQTMGGDVEIIGNNSIEATTESVLNCYIAVTFAYIWLHTIPSCLSLLLFVYQSPTFFLSEMIAFLFKLIGYSINAAIYFWLRKDFNEAFRGLFNRLCTLEQIGVNRRPQIGITSASNVRTNDDWY